MINKVNSTSFKGTISVIAGQKSRTDSGRTYIFDKNRELIRTEDITDIEQHEKQGYTLISTDNILHGCKDYYVPYDVSSTSDILAAYNVANSNKIIKVELEDKSTK